MTEIQQKQEGQTGANYFIERLKERGINTKIKSRHLENHFIDDVDQTDLDCVLDTKPKISICLGYFLEEINDPSETIPNDLAKVPDLSYKYCDDTAITITEYKDSQVHLHMFNDDTFCDIDGHGQLGESFFPDNDEALIPIAETLCALADYVKQRQDFYKSEEQK